MPTKGNVTRPRIEPMLMIRPSCCRRMEGSTARVTRSSPMTFVSKIACACSVVKASVTPAEAMPALLTSTSIVPASASTFLTPASTDVSSLTSSSTVLTPSLRRASAASRFLPCAPRIEAYTVWPAPRRVSAVSRPKPLLAPVIRIVLDILDLLEQRELFDATHSLHEASCIAQLIIRRGLAPAHHRQEGGAVRSRPQHLEGRGIRQRGVAFAELGRHAGRVAPGDREAPLGDEEQCFSGAVDRQSRLVRIEPDGKHAEVARVESWQVVDPVTELADLEQRIWTAVVHRRAVAGRRVRRAASAAARPATSTPAAASRKKWLPVATMTSKTNGG